MFHFDLSYPKLRTSSGLTEVGTGDRKPVLIVEISNREFDVLPPPSLPTHWRHYECTQNASVSCLFSMYILIRGQPEHHFLGTSTENKDARNGISCCCSTAAVVYFSRVHPFIYISIQYSILRAGVTK